MKVFLITEGGKNIGFGHITRCISLAQAFEEKNIRPELIINGDNAIKTVLKGRKYLALDWLKEKEKFFGLIKNADVVIIDSYLAGYGFYKKVAELAPLAAYLDDNKRLKYPKGVVINGSVYAQDIYYPERNDPRYLCGIQFALLRKEFWHAKEKIIKKDIEEIMLTFGGDDKSKMTAKILKFLINEYPRLIKNVIIQRSFQDGKEIEALKDKKTNLIYGPGAEELKKIMLKSDIVISAGGQTLNELARVGVPAIGVSIAENQLKNVIGWKKVQFLEYAGRYNDRNLLKRMKVSISYLEDMLMRKNKSEIGRKTVDGEGARRVAKFLIRYFFKSNIFIRKARSGDARNIFNLSNDTAVRRNSFNPEKFGWNHHIKWFRERLADKNYTFFILNIRDRFAGQVRFKRAPDEKYATIDISLLEGMRGLGLASFVLDRAINEFLKTHKNITSIKAYVKNENISSIKSFENAHFKFLEYVKVNREKANVYFRKN